MALKYGSAVAEFQTNYEMRIWIIRGNRECSRAQLRPINIRRDAEWNAQIRWRKLIESDARWFQLPECKTIHLEQRSCRIQSTIRHASGSINDSWTTPDGTHRQILRHRSAPQGSYDANYNSEIETNLWRSHRRYAADELFTKEPLRAEYRSRQDISKNY